MCYAYFAGILGKSTKHLPLPATESSEGKAYTDYFDWSLYSENMPIKFVSRYEWNGEMVVDTEINFR